MGYWIIVGMIMCAFGMVIIALSVDVESIPARTGGDARRKSESDREAQENSPSKVFVRWTAFVPSGIARPWPAQIDAADWGARPTMVALSDPSIAGIRSAVMNLPVSDSPHIVSMQVGLDDLLSGASRDTFLDVLSDVLQLLRFRNVVAVVGDIPDLSRLSLPGGETLTHDSLRRLAEDWNAEISRTVRTIDSALVDLFDVPLTETFEKVGDSHATSHSSRLDQVSIAAIFRPAIEAAIRFAALQAPD